MLRRILIPFLLVALAGTYVVMNRPTMATEYQDSSGRIFECSKAIKVKEAEFTILGHKVNVPVDNADAEKYCHYVGVE